MGGASMEKILTVNDVAEVLQVKPITVREMFREQRIRGFKVGKAWRTTEEMLTQDISSLARGESPPPMPEATKTAPAPRSNGKKRSAVKKEKPPVEAAPTPDEVPVEEVAAAPKEKKQVAKTESVEDDTQGLLF